MGLVRREQVRLIPSSGVNRRAIAVAPPKDKPDAALRLLFVGRLLGDKGVSELAEAMRLLRPRYPKLELTLVGELGAANRTAIAKEELDGWVGDGLLTHAVHERDVRPFIKAADTVMLPSYPEGMPRALLEAAADGLAPARR